MMSEEFDLPTQAQRDAFDRLAETNPDYPMQKFFAWRQFAPDAFVRARDVGLEGASSIGSPGAAGVRVLDLGCGLGWFAWACRRLGHDAIGLDVPDPVIGHALRILAVPYVPCAIRPFELLPLGLRGFDLVTTQGVNLAHPDGTFWGWQEWLYLARDVLSRLAGPGARWVVHPNMGEKTDFILDRAYWLNEVGHLAEVRSTPRRIEFRLRTQPERR